MTPVAGVAGLLLQRAGWTVQALWSLSDGSASHCSVKAALRCAWRDARAVSSEASFVSIEIKFHRIHVSWSCVYFLPRIWLIEVGSAPSHLAAVCMCKGKGREGSSVFPPEAGAEPLFPPAPILNRGGAVPSARLGSGRGERVLAFARPPWPSSLAVSVLASFWFMLRRSEECRELYEFLLLL